MLSEAKHLGIVGKTPSPRSHLHLPGQILRYRSELALSIVEGMTERAHSPTKLSRTPRDVRRNMLFGSCFELGLPGQKALFCDFHRRASLTISGEYAVGT